MGADEAGTLTALKAVCAEVIDRSIAAHSGRVVKLMGDGALVEFASVVDVVSCEDGLQIDLVEVLLTRQRSLAFQARSYVTLVK